METTRLTVVSDFNDFYEQERKSLDEQERQEKLQKHPGPGHAWEYMPQKRVIARPLDQRNLIKKQATNKRYGRA